MNGEEIARKGKFGVRLVQDGDPSNPCEEYDLAGTMVCWHSRYNLGHTGGNRHGRDHGEYAGMWETPTDFREWWKENGDGGILLPLALIDHSGLSMWVGSDAHQCDPGGWDSGQVGYIFVTRDKILEEWGGGKAKRVTKKMRERAEKCLRTEVEEYDKYLTGDVWGYVVTEYESEDEDAEVAKEDVDSCWGFFGHEYAKQEAMGVLDYYVKNHQTNDEWVRI